MGGGNAPPPPTPIIVGAFLMTFAAGLLDASTYLCLHSTSTHMSGKVLKIGITAGDLDSDIHNDHDAVNDRDHDTEHTDQHHHTGC